MSMNVHNHFQYLLTAGGGEVAYKNQEYSFKRPLDNCFKAAVPA